MGVKMCYYLFRLDRFIFFIINMKNLKFIIFFCSFSAVDLRKQKSNASLYIILYCAHRKELKPSFYQ